MSQDNNFSQGPVPQSARKGVLALTFVMLGLTFFSASMWTGGTLGTGLSYHDFFLAVLIGNLLLGIYTSFLGYIGAKTGLTTHLLARFSFGVKGSWLPSLLLGGTQVGWFGVGVAMFAIPVGKATGLDINLLIAVSGLLMTVTVFFGISALTVLSVIAVPAIACLGGYSVWLAVNGMGGLDALKAVVPAQPLDFNVALALVVGSFISAGTLTADFVRFGRNAKLAVLVAMVAFFLGNSLMFIFGAAGAAALAMADSQGVEAALGWIQTRPGITTARQRLLLRLLMARVAEQYGKNEMALLLLEELDTAAQGITLTQWEPELLFEVKARQLKLLRLRAHRHADKAALARKMDALLGSLVAIDPARTAVLCDTQHKD